MQCRFYYSEHSIRLLQGTVRRLSSSNREKVINNISSKNEKAKWYQNGLNRPLLSGTNTFEKRNIFLM